MTGEIIADGRPLENNPWVLPLLVCASEVQWVTGLCAGIVRQFLGSGGGMIEQRSYSKPSLNDTSTAGVGRTSRFSPVEVASPPRRTRVGHRRMRSILAIPTYTSGWSACATRCGGRANRANFGIQRVIGFNTPGLPVAANAALKSTVTTSRQIQFGMKLIW